MSKNCTVPVPTGDTLPEMVTFWSQSDVGGSTETSTLVATRLTWTTTLFEVSPLWHASPLYTAVNECEPGERLLRVSGALPDPLTGTGAPIGFAPS